MKYLLVFVFFVEMLQAEYLRTIRIGSFPTQQESMIALDELNEFISLYPEIRELEADHGFEFKARRSGKYYITLVEPFTQRAVLQRVIDILRIGYPDVYVTSLKKKPEKTTEKIIEALQSQKPPLPLKEDTLDTDVQIPQEVLKEVAQLAVEDEESVSDSVELLEDEMVPEVDKLTINQDGLIMENEIIVNDNNAKEGTQTVKDATVETIKDIDNSIHVYIWQAISFALLLVMFYLLLRTMKYKKENDIHQNSRMIQDERYEQLTLEMKDREKYLSHASHELRTPMTSIMGLTHLVLDADLGPQEREYIKQIESSATNLLNIVNDILDVSKIKAGELHIEKVEFNINDVLEYVLNSISMQVKKNNINCVIDIGKDIPSHLIGDSLRLGQVLINLLGNAVKFAKDGTVELHVKKVSDFGDSISIEFNVVDDGIGMSPDQLKHVFQSFSQANSSTSRKFGGTGLGLSISQELVSMMKGELKVKSELAKGTTFHFVLPFKLKDHLNKRQYRLPSPKFLNKRVLVIDKFEKNSSQLVAMLGYFNYQIHTIPSFEASIIDESIDYDIVIINKEQLDFITAEKMQYMKHKSNCKMVVLNELFSSLKQEILENLEVDAYLQQPLHQQKILNLIVNLYASKKKDPKENAQNSKHILQEMSGKSILIAEDNEVNHKVISGLLADTGIEITYALNGKEAVDTLLSGKKFDLILMDLGMPVMDGYEAAKEIRKHKIFDTVPILALSADVMDLALGRAVDSGMQGHISKPIVIDIFYKKIYDELNRPIKPIQRKELLNIDVAKLEQEYEEISIAVGLERYNNDVEFYSSILKDFKKMYINTPLDLEEMCRIGNYKEARHKAMDIKDVALSIGAYKLCESAAAMEYNLEKGPRSDWMKLISSYEEELERLFKDIDKYLKKSHS